MLRLKNIPVFTIVNMNASYFRDKNRDAIIFTAQRTKWNHNQLSIQSTALSRGLKQYQFIQGDRLLSRLSPQQQMQQMTLKIAAENLGVQIISSKANNEAELSQEIKQSKARALIFDSYRQVGERSIIQTIYDLSPTLRNALHGTQIRTNQFRYLRFLIQTDNYPFAGTIPLKNIIKYGLSSDYTFFFDSKKQPYIALGDPMYAQRPIFITSILNDFVFRAAILNSLVHSRVVYCVQAQNFNKISQTFGHEIDYVCSEQFNINPSVRVYVPKQSKLYRNHKKRIQI